MTLDADVRALLECPNFFHVSTLLPDGGPHVTAAWVGLAGDDRVCFFSETRSRKARNLARDPRVAFSVVDQENPYRTAHLRGRVVETLEGDAALSVVDQLSVLHTGEPYVERAGFVAFVCEIDRAGFSDFS